MAAVPWARHRARFTWAFDDQVAWLATRSAQSTVATLLRVTWGSVAGIGTRVVAASEAGRDPFAHLERIGIHEIHVGGPTYLVVVVDHDTGHLIWAAPSRDDTTLGRFFNALGDARCRQVRRVSRDGPSWIATTVAARCPQAIPCTDPFHVAGWATAALNDVRRQVWNTARRDGGDETAHALKGARWAVWHNPANLTAKQQLLLETIARTNRPLYRGYLLTEGLRLLFWIGSRRALAELSRWVQ